MNYKELKKIFLSHDKININADGILLKYIRFYETDNFDYWQCNGEILVGSTLQIVKILYYKHKNIKIISKS